MARIEIPYYLTPKLGVEMNAGHYLVSVELRDGRLFTNLVVKEGRFITGRRDDPNGEGTLLFTSMDICDIQRHAFVYGRALTS
ncbi:hypothetical protein GTP58_20205 [Duganella sp. CY15W]|uniref:hypothetical protein n=1 Tax=Duganella sp. CY15W TaxID=2692172 RepID=UPI0013697DE4|nr:hypothetical protein [Duganella sp. CY15W]MYM30659.1 hypothetical protein [Duganella sp. CY15W]